MDNRINKIADEIVKTLSPYFTIQRYDAHKTDSIYLKLDYGVCNSIRISDHPGKRHLQYRYNLIIGGEVNIIEEEYIRYFYNEETYGDLLCLIIFDKKAKLDKYGVGRYVQFMNRNKELHESDKKGFWHNARLVSEKEV